ncbi:hypothetical protein SM007_27935 [Streptomyces avermitilis]|nr:hypothetical protein SM007_27935 [Streptomyces avermitilis]
MMHRRFARGYETLTASRRAPLSNPHRTSTTQLHSHIGSPVRTALGFPSDGCVGPESRRGVPVRRHLFPR